MALEETIKGRCNCGAITVAIPKEAWPASCALCHCLNCRASSGSLFSLNMAIPVSEVKVGGEGTPKVFSDGDSGSGNTVDRHFCGECGTAIMSVVKEAPDTAYVKGGPFSRLGVELPEVAAHVWWKRREKWEETPKDGVVCID